jgi:REP element-mobilizing transposase RayT
VIVFVTVCTAARKMILARDEIRELLCRVWTRANGWCVGRYVVMPDHVHLFCAPATVNAPPLDRWVAFWKSRASQQWPRPDEHPIWQKSFWDIQLRRGESYEAKWEYVRANPVRHGLAAQPQNWPYQGQQHVLEWHD